jgi:hypothetical protein
MDQTDFRLHNPSSIFDLWLLIRNVRLRASDVQVLGSLSAYLLAMSDPDGCILFCYGLAGDLEGRQCCSFGMNGKLEKGCRWHVGWKYSAVIMDDIGHH